MVIYIFVVSVLIVITIDGEIFWYEALILVILHVLYFIVMFQNDKLSSFVRKLVSKKSNKIYAVENNLDKAVAAKKPKITIVSFYGLYKTDEPIERFVEKTDECESNTLDKEETSLFKIPKKSFLKMLFFFYLWPLKFILLCLVPNPKTHPKLYPLTFLLCVAFIGSNSYLVSWMMTIFGIQQSGHFQTICLYFLF